MHVTWVPDGPAVHDALGELEPLLAAFDARPHWGKVFRTPADQVRARYRHLDDLADLAARCDPHGRFRNDFVSAHLPR